MTETVLLDYIQAASKLDQKSFCSQLGIAVMLPAKQLEGSSFQDALTQSMNYESLLSADSIYDEKTPVVEIGPMNSGQNENISLGRSEENDVVIQEESISGRHASFSQDPDTGRVDLLDLSSRNGTKVNSKILTADHSIALSDGDLVAFGDVIYLFFTPNGFYLYLKMVANWKPQ